MPSRGNRVAARQNKLSGRNRQRKPKGNQPTQPRPAPTPDSNISVPQPAQEPTTELAAAKRPQSQHPYTTRPAVATAYQYVKPEIIRISIVMAATIALLGIAVYVLA